MSDISKLITNLSESEKQHFKSYLASRTNSKESKLLRYLDLLYTHVSSRIICETIYGSYPKTGFYALRKRVNSIFIEFFAYEKGRKHNIEENDINLFFKAGQNLILFKHYHLGFQCMEKALKKSKENELHAKCAEILLAIIQVAHLQNSLSLAELVEDYHYQVNLKAKHDTITIAYAEIKERLNFFFTNSIQVNTLQEIEDIFYKHKLNFSIDANFRILFQIGQITLAKSHVTKNYANELNLLESQTEKIILAGKPKNFSEKIYKIKLMYLLASSNFRSNRFQKSTNYINSMQKFINKSNLDISEEMKFKIAIVKSLNFNYLGFNTKANKTLTDFMRNSKLEKKNKNWLDGYGAMSLILFHGKQYRKISHLYRQFNKKDTYYASTAGIEWVIRKNLILILTYFELGEIEKSLKYITTFKTENARFLRENKKVRFFLYCAEKVVSSPLGIESTRFHKFIESNIETKPRIAEDIFVVSFFAWLKSKIEKKDTYQTTIEVAISI
ncbi:MAG: hypothetical protein ABF242_05205 [Flavobacteriales bacterium]